MNTRRDTIVGRTLGIGAALAYGVSAVLVRQGIADMTTPLVGAAISLLSGTLVMAAIGVKSRESNLRQKKRSVAFLLIAGVTAAAGILSSFFALSMAPVVVVSPLQSISPLFALLWSYLFLGQLERITLRVILGTLLVVGGVALVAIGRVA